MVTAALLLSLGRLEFTNPELRAYVEQPDTSFKWTEKQVLGHRSFELTSQTWQGTVWQHDLVLLTPREVTKRIPGAIIEVTGWEPNKTDLDDAQTMADASGMTVAVLFQIPKQPLWDHEEDDLIAHTFERFMQTGDPTWPLLFPMVKSVRAAMDALQQAKVADKFVVTGASKRGWTTWLVGEIGDARVVGIAPRVFDNLDFPKQLAQQKAYWGVYSPMIQDYTDRGLQDLLGTPQGKKLIQLVDPMASLSQVHSPVMVVTGTNDPYWTVDSTQLYWDQIRAPKYALAVPSSGHVLTDKDWWLRSIGQFAAKCSTGRPQTPFTASLTVDDVHWSLQINSDRSPLTHRLWTASSPDLHFENAKWVPGELLRNKAVSGDVVTIGVSAGRTGDNIAVMMELTYDDGMRITTPVHLVRKK